MSEIRRLVLKHLSKYDKDRLSVFSCLSCGDNVERHVDPSDRGNLKVFCYKCRQRAPEHIRRLNKDTSDGPLRWVAWHVFIHYGSEAVKIFLPGDSGFEERAREFNDNRIKQKLPPVKGNHCGQG